MLLIRHLKFALIGASSLFGTRAAFLSGALGE